MSEHRDREKREHRRVVVTGSHGLIGSELVATLRRTGDEVTRLVRSATAPGDAAWDIDASTIDAAALEGHDAVVHLAGAGIGDHRWSDADKREIHDSRTRGTTLLCETLAKLERPPRVLVSGSAVGWYGDRGDEELSEASAPGRGFLASVVKDWEAATEAASDAGIRVVRLRSGVVLSRKGGALKKQLLPFKLGAGGKLGSGRQWLSWIALDDEIGAILHLIRRETLRGPVNATAPNPVTNAEFTDGARGRPPPTHGHDGAAVRDQGVVRQPDGHRDAAGRPARAAPALEASGFGFGTPASTKPCRPCSHREPLARPLSGEARLHRHARAVRARRTAVNGRTGALRRAGAPRRRAALGLPARARRRARVVGAAQGRAARPRRQPSRRPHRGPSALVHRLRGRDPAGEYGGGRGHLWDRGTYDTTS